LDAEIVVDDRGQSVKPVKEAILDLVGDLEPIAKTLDCADELRNVERLLDVGASYQRQRAVAERNEGDLRAVVDALLTEMNDGVFAKVSGSSRT
jgi:carboxylate-amine ligase